MPLEDDLHSFKLWAAKIGFPMADMPIDESLKSIFKSRQHDLFCKLMDRVRPRQEVTEIRENILIKKLKKFDGQLVPQCSRSFLPKEKQMFLKIQDLKQEKSKLENRIAEYNKEYESLAQTIKTRNIQIMKAQHNHDSLESKVNILYLKSQALDKDIAKEQKNNKCLIRTMPVKLNARNACETAASAAVVAALKELDKFYDVYISNTSSHILHDAKDNLWKTLRTTFDNIPNNLIFKSIVRLKELQIQHLMSLNKTSVTEAFTCTSAHSNSAREPLSTFELKLMKTKAELLGIVAKLLAASHESKMLDERFTDTYFQFTNKFEAKCSHFYTGTEDDRDFVDEKISNFIVALNIHYFEKAKKDYLTQQIQIYKAHLETGARQLVDHEVLLSSIKQVYSEISTSINRIGNEMKLLGQIKKKIAHSKDVLQHMLNKLQPANSVASNAKPNFLPENVSFIGSGGYNESFDSCGVAITSAVDGSIYLNARNNSDNIFSSTAYDLDSTLGYSANMSNRNMSKIPAGGCGLPGRRYMLPPYASEITTFAGISFEKFNLMSKRCAFYLAPNPVIMSPREGMAVLQLSPGTLLTAFGVLQEVSTRIQLAKAIEEIPKDVKLDIDMTIVKNKELQFKTKQQSDENSELLDKMDLTVDKLNHTYKNVNKLYDFIIENPLRNFIPPKRLFKDQTYMDFESEFTMYYRMATESQKFK